MAAIRERLAWFADNDAAGTVFGAIQHRWQLAPPLSEEAVGAFEAAHGVSLPADYRAFLLAVGDGGAGPYYGLSPLAPLERETMPSHHVVAKDEEGRVLAEAGTGPRPVPDVVSSTARPFPLTGEWRLADGRAPVERGASVYDGCVHLCEQGCGYFDFLVVHGEAAGQVWSDYTAGDGPITKAHDTFLDWYERWLEGAHVEWLERNARDMALWAPRHFAGIDEHVRLLDAALEEKPEWADGWRARGYVHLNREAFDAATAAFETAAEHGRDEPKARLHLDRARLARFRNDSASAVAECDAGLAEENLWASTKTELLDERLVACDALEDTDGALETLEALAKSSYFTRKHHYRLAGRRLARGEPELAWAVLDQAIADNVDPDRGRTKATRHGVYEEFAGWLEDIGQAALGAQARDAMGPAPAPAWGESDGTAKSWSKNADPSGESRGPTGE